MRRFYQNAFDALSWQHDRTKDGFIRDFETGLTPEEYKEKFAQVCAFTYGEEQYEFEVHEFLETINTVRGMCPDERIYTSKQFLNDSTNSLCLMVRDGHKIRFSHRSFQEYFTGLYIVEQTEPNEWYGKITEMITFGNREIFTLLEFMFGIKKTKFEDWVIRPYLNEILSGTDYNEGYEKFLLTLFPTIGCEVGEVGCLLADRDYFPSLYALIRYKRGFNREYKIAESELPFYPEFVQDEVYLCKGEEDDSNLYTVPGRLIGDSLQIIDENPVGYYLSIPTKKVLAKPEKYPDLYAALMNDEFTLKTEFFKMKRYLKTLEDRATKPKMALLRGKRK